MRHLASAVLGSWVRVALIDLRGGLRRFGVLLACLALGVGTIAAVGSVGSVLQAAVARDARTILGGDLEVRLTGREASPPELAAISALGQVSTVIELSSRASAGDNSAFLSLRAVDQAYPLAGTVETDPAEPLASLLAPVDGVPGAVVDQGVLDRLGITLGQSFALGDATYRASAVLKSLPDQAAQGFTIGQPAIVAIDTLQAAGLMQPGALTHYRYKVLFSPSHDFETASAGLKQAFPDAGWEVRQPKDATANLSRFFDLFARFLVLVGLSALLVGGVGVSNAVAAYITERQSSIATLRSLGATSGRIFFHFLLQIMVLAVVGVLLGLALGGATTLVALPILSGMLSLQLTPQLDPAALLTAAGFGLLIAFAFAYLPLQRAQKLRPASLFRAAGAAGEGGLTWRNLLAPRLFLPMLVALGLIGGLAVLSTGEPMLVVWYAIGTLVAFGLLRLAALILQIVLRLVPPLPNATLRLAFKNIHRPGAPAPVVILSLGLGLALLLLIALIDFNLRSQIGGAIADQAPSFVVLDMLPDEVPELEAFAKQTPAITAVQTTPMLRAAITAVKGKPATELGPLPDDVADMFKGDTPVTWVRALPAGSSVVEGQWWASDYSGEPLISVSTEMSEALDLKLGDTMDFSILGRPLTARIQSIRKIDWREAGPSFRLLFSPGEIEGAPATAMGTIKVAKGEEHRVESALAKAMPDLTFLPVADALSRVADILTSLSNAVSLVGSLAVFSGLFVLAGAMSVGRRQRQSDAMVMKVLGATRANVVLAFVIEYGLLGLLSAGLGAALGVTGAWAILTNVLEIDFTLNAGLVALVVIGAMVMTILVGMITTWSALSVRPARQLRAEGL